MNSQLQSFLNFFSENSLSSSSLANSVDSKEFLFFFDNIKMAQIAISKDLFIKNIPLVLNKHGISSIEFNCEYTDEYEKIEVDHISVEDVMFLDNSISSGNKNSPFYNKGLALRSNQIIEDFNFQLISDKQIVKILENPVFNADRVNKIKALIYNERDREVLEYLKILEERKAINQSICLSQNTPSSFKV